MFKRMFGKRTARNEASTTTENQDNVIVAADGNTLPIWTGTQAQYDAIGEGNYDTNTLYLITKHAPVSAGETPSDSYRPDNVPDATLSFFVRKGKNGSYRWTMYIGDKFVSTCNVRGYPSGREATDSVYEIINILKYGNYEVNSLT